MNNCPSVSLGDNVVAFCCEEATYYYQSGQPLSVVSGQSGACVAPVTVAPLILKTCPECSCEVWQALFGAVCGFVLMTLLIVVIYIKVKRCSRPRNPST